MAAGAGTGLGKGQGGPLAVRLPPWAAGGMLPWQQSYGMPLPGLLNQAMLPGMQAQLAAQAQVAQAPQAQQPAAQAAKDPMADYWLNFNHGSSGP
ncbi:hypothetical protein FHP25_05455 [Vineibacter terrae]|uniref:Uncharacterized protein n=1 Tax=Vineibacter terrae TaxID=2586908 RepID=A0A5C8PTQ2_9HYPH|nr:hypothetical protein [Vineibacter terrae]TXL80472.1 hypothetical protein FHP25_05455 [Vineibacter terrae]